MAGLWMFGEGPEPTDGHRIAESLPVDACVSTLGLVEQQFVAPPETPPLFNENTGSWVGAKDHYTVVTLDTGEASAKGWPAGYYLLDITVPEARRRLGLPE